MSGILSKNIKEQIKSVSIPTFYKNNTILLLNKYKNPDNTCKVVPISDIFNGGIYFVLYLDESNWMRYSPIFVVEYKMKKMVFAVNFNFIPLEIREAFFNSLIINLTDNRQLSEVSLETVYKMLIRYGFEYSIVEYDINRIKVVYQIDISLLPNFIYSGHPKNKYDPLKLYDIWAKKLADKEERHQQMTKTLLTDFYEAKSDLDSEFGIMKEHFKRFKRNQDKYGK